MQLGGLWDLWGGRSQLVKFYLGATPGTGSSFRASMNRYVDIKDTQEEIEDLTLPHLIPPSRQMDTMNGVRALRKGSL